MSGFNEWWFDYPFSLAEHGSRESYRAAYEAGRKEHDGAPTVAEWRKLVQEHAETQAQLAAVREALDAWAHDEDCLRQLGRYLNPPKDKACDCNIADTISATAPTVEAFLSRVREEAKREERERCAEYAQSVGVYPGVVAAIRSLGEQKDGEK